MANQKKKAEVYLLNKKCPDNTMIPCPYCLTFHSVKEYFKVMQHWRGDVLRGFMNVMESDYDTQCPVCRGIFQLHKHSKMLNSNRYKLAYYTIPRKMR